MCAPRFGVYATRTRLPDGREHRRRRQHRRQPDHRAASTPRLEVWLFDFDEDIYGQTIETDLIAFLRPEEKFRDAPAIESAMVEQVHAGRAPGRKRSSAAEPGRQAALSARPAARSVRPRAMTAVRTVQRINRPA